MYFFEIQEKWKEEKLLQINSPILFSLNIVCIHICMCMFPLLLPCNNRQFKPVQAVVPGRDRLAFLEMESPLLQQRNNTDQEGET